MKQPVALLAILLTGVLCCGIALTQAPKTTPTPPASQVLCCPAVIQAPKTSRAAASPAVATESMASEPAHEMTAADVGAFLDGFMPMQLERENIAGAVVLVVKDGRVLFAKGYGYSNAEKKTPVTVDATLFRLGSISKLFTWTAVMQLVEQGKLDLDRDVNTYLDFKIPATFPQPITLRNIMTHTPGFEEQIKDLINQEGDPMATLREHLVRHMPERIFPPGTTPAYSNYGAALAGYVVQRVSGRPFNDYVAENIFQPLGMLHSTFVQPLPAELKPLMSSGYNSGSGKAKPFELIEEAPAGALAASAADMSRFMMAHLQNGTLEGAHILRPETARLMHSRQFGLVPELNGMCLGFYEESRNGHRIIGHGGDTFYFHSDLHLVPDAGLGFFVSYNSAGKGEISPRTALWHHFLDRYFPYTPPAAPQLAGAPTDGASVAGRYMASRRSQTNFLKITSMQGEATVQPDEKDRKDIKVEGFKDFNGEVKKWQEIAPLIYRAVNGQDLLAFRRDGKGRLQLVPNIPIFVFQRVSLLQDKNFNLPLLIGCLVVMGLTLLFWPVGALIRRHYHQRLEMDAPQRRARLWIRLVCALNTIFVLAMLQALSNTEAGAFSEKLDLHINLVQAVGVLGALGTVLVLIACLRSWRDRNLWAWAKVWNLIVLLACAGFTWFLLYWNLLDFSKNY
jgi:CubicO group peptidase (beta-lactamase class C family)